MRYLVLLINILFTCAYLLIIARVFLSWSPDTRFQKRFKLVYRWTEPLLKVIRIALPPEKMGVDASPFFAIILLWVLQNMVVGFLLRF